MNVHLLYEVAIRPYQDTCDVIELFDCIDFWKSGCSLPCEVIVWPYQDIWPPVLCPIMRTCMTHMCECSVLLSCHWPYQDAWKSVICQTIWTCVINFVWICPKLCEVHHLAISRQSDVSDMFNYTDLHMNVSTAL